MSRGHNNDAYEMERYPSRQRVREEPPPEGPSGDRYYQDEGYRRRTPRELHRSFRGFKNKGIDPYRSDRDNDEFDHRSRWNPRRDDGRGHNYPHRPDQRRETESRTERYPGSMDEIEKRFQKYTSGSDDEGDSRRYRNSHNPRHQPRQHGERSGPRDRDNRGQRDWRQRPSTEYYEMGAVPPYGYTDRDEYRDVPRSFPRKPHSENEYYSNPYSFRGPERADHVDPYGTQPPHSQGGPDPHEIGLQPRRNSQWDDVMQMLPSEMDRAKGTLRFRGTMGRAMASMMGDVDPADTADVEEEEQDNQPTTKAEIYENLLKLREQPWPLKLRKQRKYELKQKLETMGDTWFNVGPVVSVVESGTNTLKDVSKTLDPLNGMLKRIEGKHGASVVAVFNFIRDMIRLNLVLALLLLCGVVIPSSSYVSVDTDQGYGWDTIGGNCSYTPGDLCSAIQLLNDSASECNQNYTEKVREDTEASSTNFIALVRDFLQGTGFLEWTLLFSGYYPAVVESYNYLIGLAYLLTVLTTYFISLIFVVRSVAKFLRNISSSSSDYGMVFSKIIFTGWDYSVKESSAAKAESAVIVCEVKAAFDDEYHNSRYLSRTTKDKVKLYLGRFGINLIIVTLIGGSWAGIYFLVKEAQRHTEETPFIEFIWEYAPTLTVAGLNLIFPMVFSFLVTYEQYRGQTELFLTLSRCVLVRLTSLAILIITKVGLISNQPRSCNPDDEFICWETHLGQQVYSVLILDAIIQIGMTFVVNVARWSLKKIDNDFCKKIGTIEFFVPGHVLDVVYIQAVCWIGLLYSPLIVTMCLLHFSLTFFLKLFTVSVTCVPATRVFRASRSSAMFMTILALAFLICLIPNGLAVLYLCPSEACSPFRGLPIAWDVITYYICGINDRVYWIRSFLFGLDNTMVSVALVLLVFIAAVYYISLITARGALVNELEKKLKNANKDKNFLMEEYNRTLGSGAAG